MAARIKLALLNNERVVTAEKREELLAAGEVRGDELFLSTEALSKFVTPANRPTGPRQDAESSGPGTELKALLKKVGISANPGCSCNTRAKLMDANELKEPGWCEKNLETICDWLQEEATKRKLPFVRMAAKILVRQAIRNARKKGQ